ncbi:MAG: LytR C-terminal domain-containing protein [Actinomycetota bacterium]
MARPSLRTRLRLSRRGRARVIWGALLCAALVATGIVVASLTQTRIDESGELEDARSAASPARPAENAGSGAAGAGGVSDAAEGPGAQERKDVKLITAGVTVQVLNATATHKADDRMVDRLTDLGFPVLAVNRAAARYDHTTVFWSTTALKPAAEALAQRFGWRAAHKPRNLSGSVTTHVVVGRDEA